MTDFEKGYNKAIEDAANLYEIINPASDEEKHNKIPGSGAMSTILQYRDEIRKLRINKAILAEAINTFYS